MMSRSLIQVANPSTQAVAVNSIIAPGSVQRRFGCNCRLIGNAVEVAGEGYYVVDAGVTVAPTVAGNVTVGLYVNGTLLPGAVGYGTAAAAGDPVTLPITATIRQGCNCDSADNLTLVLMEGAGNVQNVSMRVEKA